MTSLRQPAAILYGNGVSTTLSYDNLHRPDSITVRNGSGTMFHNRYAYDEAGNRTRVTETDGTSIDYRFDEEEQLRFADYSRIPGVNDIEYRYDAWGNRTYLKNPAETASSTINNNELSALSYNQGRLRVNMEYDGNGSLIREQFVRGGIPNKETRYGYDGQNRLTSIAYTSLNRPTWLPALPENRLEFSYSDDGNRVKKSVNGTSAYYLNDGLAVLNEMNGTGAPTKSIVKGLSGEQIADIGANGVVKYLHQDALGSTALMTDANGAVTQKHEYDPFGRLVGAEGNEANKYQFTGQEYDPESELAYMNARYYNPRIGRFLSRDLRLGAVGDLLSRNPYIYVKNNPLKYTDPSGNDEKKKQEEEDARKRELLRDAGANGLGQSANSTPAYCLKNCPSDVNPFAAFDYLPYAGDISDFYAMQTGRTLFGQRKLSESEKENIGMYAIMPILTSSQGRLVGKVIKEGDKVMAKGATVAGQFLHGVPQEAADRLMARLKGLRVGDKPVIEAIEAFGSRSTGWSNRRNAAVNAGSDLDIVVTADQRLYQGINKEWIEGIFGSIKNDFEKTANLPLSLHYPKKILEFKSFIQHLDPVASFIELFKR